MMTVFDALTNAVRAAGLGEMPEPKRPKKPKAEKIAPNPAIRLTPAGVATLGNVRPAVANVRKGFFRDPESGTGWSYQNPAGVIASNVDKPTLREKVLTNQGRMEAGAYHMAHQMGNPITTDLANAIVLPRSSRTAAQNLSALVSPVYNAPTMPYVGPVNEIGLPFDQRPLVPHGPQTGFKVPMKREGGKSSGRGFRGRPRGGETAEQYANRPLPDWTTTDNPLFNVAAFLPREMWRGAGGGNLRYWNPWNEEEMARYEASRPGAAEQLLSASGFMFPRPRPALPSGANLIEPRIKGLLGPGSTEVPTAFGRGPITVGPAEKLASAVKSGGKKTAKKATKATKAKPTDPLDIAVDVKGIESSVYGLGEYVELIASLPKTKTGRLTKKSIERLNQRIKDDNAAEFLERFDYGGDLFDAGRGTL